MDSLQDSSPYFTDFTLAEVPSFFKCWFFCRALVVLHFLRLEIDKMNTYLLRILVAVDVSVPSVAKIVDMENLYKELGDQSLNKDFCQTVASTFSCSVNRKGKASITWKQVQSWFQDKLKPNKPAKLNPFPQSPPPSPSSQFLSDLTNLGYAENASFAQRRKGKASDVSDLAFEAKSARDDAWYDVSSFLTYRVLRTGELEARVRFSGFDNRHDEWVKVKTSVRERSIPVDPSECGKVNIGDLLLCFQEREDQALYCDAHVVDIKRGFHDHGRCNCVFLVHYDHDNIEELVGLERICRRPDE